MKKILTALFLVLLCIGLCACGNSEPDPTPDPTPTPAPDPNLLEITGVSFASQAFDYDGKEKSIVAENIPDGVSASYHMNKGTNAGVYNATVTLSADGYNTKVLNATLTINKIEITGVVFEYESFKYDGEEKSITATNIPSGVTATYSNNKATEAGKYTATVTLTGANYIEKTLSAEFEIMKNIQFVISAFGKVPTPWEFLPESLNIENKVIDAVPDYTNFINISDLPTNYIGKQLNVVYGALNVTTSVLPYLNTVYGSLNVIEQAYNTFLATNPDDPTVFEDDEGTFTYKLELDDTYYVISVKISGVELEIYADLEKETYGARVQITESNVLKYDVEGDKFKVAINVLNASSTMIELKKDATTDNVTGLIYEYLTVAGKELVATSAYLYSDENYTTVIGTKGDFIPTATSRNCEVYDNKTGAFVGSEVNEQLMDGDVSYDTMWFNLKDIAGITSIKKVDEQNYLNPDKIYINGKSDTIHTKTVSFPLNLSRRFDIEMKNVCAYTYDEETGKYISVEFEVPLMFIQESVVGDFNKDFKSENDVTVTLNISSTEENAIKHGYHVLVEHYNDNVYEAVSQKDIQDYCAESVKQ